MYVLLDHTHLKIFVAGCTDSKVRIYSYKDEQFKYQSPPLSSFTITKVKWSVSGNYICVLAGCELFLGEAAGKRTAFNRSAVTSSESFYVDADFGCLGSTK